MSIPGAILTSNKAEDAQKAANLARIRDNQRRSRAKRKEYVTELEEKYRICQNNGTVASAELHAAARDVLEENARLRMLLRLYGVPTHAFNTNLDVAAQRLAALLLTDLASSSAYHSPSESSPIAGQEHNGGGVSAGMSFHQASLVPLSTAARQDYIVTASIPEQHSAHDLSCQGYNKPTLNAMSASPWLCGSRTASTSSTDAPSQYIPPISLETSSIMDSDAANILSIMKPHLEPDLEGDLNCIGGLSDYTVPNNRLFELMDKYAYVRASELA